MRKFIVAAAAATALLSACGGDDGGNSANSDTTAESPATVASATPTSATSVSTASTAAASATTVAGAGVPAGSVEVVLKEWSITSGQLKAGSVSLNVKNDGQFKHELVVIKGKFASLPKTSSGSVDTSALPAGALVGEAEDIAGGASAILEVDLAAGDYTLVCNITGGGSSHAARGQVLDVSVV